MTRRESWLRRNCVWVGGLGIILVLAVAVVSQKPDIKEMSQAELVLYCAERGAAALPAHEDIHVEDLVRTSDGDYMLFEPDLDDYDAPREGVVLIIQVETGFYSVHRVGWAGEYLLGGVVRSAPVRVKSCDYNDIVWDPAVDRVTIVKRKGDV